MYLPSWFPGATWQRTADEGRKVVDWWLTAPVQYVKDKMVRYTEYGFFLAEENSRAGRRCDRALFSRGCTVPH